MLAEHLIWGKKKARIFHKIKDEYWYDGKKEERKTEYKFSDDGRFEYLNYGKESSCQKRIHP